MPHRTASMSPTADHDHAFFVHESGGELDRELAQRLSALGQPPHNTSECLQSVRSIFTESVVWMVIGAAIWMIAIMATR